VTEIAIAFDVESLDEALALDARFGPGPEYAKIGLELFTRVGPRAVEALKARGRRVFLDLKLHDIPNTVKGAASAAASLGAELLTVHALGGEEMIASAAGAIAAAGGATRIVAVTLLTSLDGRNPPPGLRRPLEVADTVAEMLEMAERAGAHGIVCSAQDLPGVRARHPRAFFAVTPGIRPAGSAAHDQKRVTTVGDAVRLGSSLLVLGRAITSAPDPRAALESARAEGRAAATVQA